MEDMNYSNLEQRNKKEDSFRRLYKKPTIKRTKEMAFMFDAINQTNSKYTYRQCSSCHGYK